MNTEITGNTKRVHYRAKSYHTFEESFGYKLRVFYRMEAVL